MANKSKGRPPKANQWCDTHLKFEKFNYQWTIHAFNSRGEPNGKTISSDVFFIGPNNESKWCLTMYPKGETKESEKYVSLYLCLKYFQTSTSGRKCKVEFSILNAEQEKKNIVQMEGQCPEKEKGIGIEKFIERANLEKNCLLPEGKLTIFCEGEIEGDSKTESGSRSKPDKGVIKISDCKLSEGFENLLLQDKFSDVTLVSKAGKEFKAHKAILATQSGKLAKMIENASEENKIEIKDIEEEVIEEMLYFIYTGKARSLAKYCKNLIIAADKYDLVRLKTLCEEELFKKLLVEVAVETLIIADDNNCNQLKTATYDFIKTNIVTVSKHEKWDQMKKTPKGSELLAGIITKITEPVENKNEVKKVNK